MSRKFKLLPHTAYKVTKGRNVPLLQGTSGNLQLNFTFRRTLSVLEGEANPKGEPAVLVITALKVATYLVWMLQGL